MSKRNRTIARFEERSLYLFTALVMAAAAPGVRAQTTPPPTMRSNPQFTSGPGPAPAAATAPTGGAAQWGPAGGGNKSTEAAFIRADSNKDGKLSREEAMRLPAVVERFDEIDADHDRFLSRAEFDKGVAL